jgi:hypothetical protein
MVPGEPRVAFEDLGGVLLTVEGAAWPADTAALAPGVTALYVTVQNAGERPLLVSRRGFALQGASGRRYPALPPAGVPVREGDRAETVVQPVFGPSDPGDGHGDGQDDGLRPLPPAPPPVPQLSRRETSFPYGRFEFKERPVAAAVRRHEPAARALPEGTLARGETIAGFVYFDAAAVEAEQRLLLEAAVAEPQPDSALRIARATIPLRVQPSSRFSR